MPQILILIKFMKYLDITSAQYLGELEADMSALKGGRSKINNLDEIRKAISRAEQEIMDHKNYIENFKIKLKEGHCFGFSLCYAAMDVAGKLDWWEQVLVQLASWDEREESLVTNVVLVDAVTDNVLLNDLIDRALNYVVFYHAQFFDIPLMQGMDQESILREQTPYFELLSTNNEVLKIQSSAVAAGCFSDKDLQELLDESMFRNTIGLVSSWDHSIRVAYADDSWVIYNPNYDHASIKNIKRIFDKKEDAIKEIIRILGHSFVLRVVSLNSREAISFPVYEKLKEENPSELVAGRGLLLMARYAPGDLAQLCQYGHNDRDLRAAFADALQLKKDDAWTGLHVVARHAPNALSQFMELADSDQDLRSAIAQMLPLKDSKGRTGLHVISRHTPAILPALFKCLLVDANHFNSIIKALTSSDDQKYTGWTVVPGIYREEILSELTAVLDKLDDKELINFGNKLRAALYQDDSEYHGLCKERDSFFFRSDYGKTHIWQELMARVQDSLKERIAKGSLLKERDDVKELQKQSVSRLNIF